MAVDRDDTLKKAEKLLKQGKMAAAIEEYVRLVEDNPDDWNSANALGDLYVKVGQAERAAEQFNARRRPPLRERASFLARLPSTRKCSRSGARTIMRSGNWRTSPDGTVCRWTRGRTTAG